jgi:hypothetical protein
MTKLKMWPVAAGVLVDWFGSLMLTVVYVSVFWAGQSGSGEPSEVVIPPAHQAITEALGLLMSALGGFVAGRLAKIEEVHHGAATGFGSLVVGLLVAWSLPAEGPQAWRDLLLPLAVVPLAAVGGYIAARMNARSAHRSTNGTPR